MSIFRPPVPPAARQAAVPSEDAAKMLAEVCTLREEIAARKAEIEALSKGEYGVKARNRRYVVDVETPYQDIDNYPAAGVFAADNPALAPFGMFTAPFMVDQGTRFYVKQISFALMAVGTLEDVVGSADIAANVVVPAVMRSTLSGYGTVNFRWKVRSSGQDREWQNQFLPDWLLLSGSRNGLKFRRAQFCIVGGVETTVTVAPARADLVGSTVVATGFSTVSSLRYQFVFGGVEVEA